MEYKDYYATLGVKKDASAEEVKRAYRHLAKQHHPDLHPERSKAAAAEKFKEINEAYDVLSDPKKRAKYDQLGPEWESARPQGPPPPPRAGAGEEAFSGFSDFFSELFGDAGRRGFGVGDASPAGSRHGEDVEAELPLSLEDALRGGEHRLTLLAPVLCPACSGAGRRGNSFCTRCAGVGETRSEKTVTAHLPKHIRDGMKLRLRGQGASAGPGRPPGDLFLRIRLLPHPMYRVSGSDLETTVTVRPSLAALGGEAPVPTLEGPVRIKIPPGTHAGRPFRIPGKGLGKEGGARGDLYAVLRIDIPDRIDKRAERLYRELGEAGS